MADGVAVGVGVRVGVAVGVGVGVRVGVGVGVGVGVAAVTVTAQAGDAPEDGVVSIPVASGRVAGNDQLVIRGSKDDAENVVITPITNAARLAAAEARRETLLKECPDLIAAMQELGIELAPHRSRAVTREMIEENR